MMLSFWFVFFTKRGRWNLPDIFLRNIPLPPLSLSHSLSLVPGNAGIAFEMWTMTALLSSPLSVILCESIGLSQFAQFLHSTHFFSIKKTRLKKNDLYLCDYMARAFVCGCACLNVLMCAHMHLFAPNSCSLNVWALVCFPHLDDSQSVCLAVCTSALLPTRAVSSSFERFTLSGEAASNTHAILFLRMCPFFSQGGMPKQKRFFFVLPLITTDKSWSAHSCKNASTEKKTATKDRKTNCHSFCFFGESRAECAILFINRKKNKLADKKDEATALFSESLSKNL